jgi:hypothetical protein
MNDTYNDTHDLIFEILHELYTRQQQAHTQLRYKSGIRHAKYS